MITLHTLRSIQRTRLASSSSSLSLSRSISSFQSFQASLNSSSSTPSTAQASPSTNSSSPPSNHKRKFPKRRHRNRKNPPRPPGGGVTLPTVDASPILAPSVYIKRTSKGHSIAGPYATKRLLIAQHKICKWIWNQIGEDQDGDYLSDFEYDSDAGLDAGLDRDRDGVEDAEGGRDVHVQEYNQLGFMLVGHGVPYLLFQDHVDCAWDMLNGGSNGNGGSSSSSVDDGEVVECSFSNDTGKLNFDWIKVRKRDNTIAKYPMPKMIENQSEQLYLAVMNRISTTLGTILLTQPPPNSPNVNTDKYWKKDISSPMSHWRVTFKRGFVYPPSVTSAYSFDSYDQRGAGEKRRGEYWTGPPIVELISSKPSSPSGQVEEQQQQQEGVVEKKSGVEVPPNFVKVTLQGIPSVFWKAKEEDCDSDVRKDDMVPISLVFEACFEQGKNE